ncbi:ABC transporter substrate-binding protein [Pseudodesulfovibrio sp.]|uniref:ABC transporter substrate-binding protein n=1 Tax=Pseudodesulfovibrio sp. TaxID=2035812 RepID=UPI0026229010|nr:ABC transporter substrate-binding protein [Pseudodesulfovibrio sp.]MDD3311121.1 ABC transporter substrate-binding protein [Pseudodesulfovibrio sp.]
MSKIRQLLFSCALCAALVGLSAYPAQCEKPAKELVFGMSAAFTGATGELGIEFYRGFMAYIDQFNAQGGAGGWTIRVEPANDGYNLIPCFRNTLKFIEDDEVFALFSYVGTPTTTHILPLLQKYEDRHVYLLFPFTGAMPLRAAPFGRYVYNLRASYFQETAGLVDHLVGIGRSRIAVFYQSDAYGRTGWDGVRRALRRHGLPLVSEAAYQRGASFDQDFGREVKHIMAAEPDAVIVVGTYASQAAFVRNLRDAGYAIPVAGLSFADSDKMLELLMRAERETGRGYTSGLINSQVVPSYEDTSLPGVRRYRELMDAYAGIPDLSEQGYKPRRFSFVSFEGFLNGVLLGEMVRRMADNPTRERIPEVLESIRDFDLGIGVNVTFGPGDHQGLDVVYYTTVVEGRFQPLADWEGLRP